MSVFSAAGARGRSKKTPSRSHLSQRHGKRRPLLAAKGRRLVDVGVVRRVPALVQQRRQRGEAAARVRGDGERGKVGLAGDECAIGFTVDGLGPVAEAVAVLAGPKKEGFFTRFFWFFGGRNERTIVFFFFFFFALRPFSAATSASSSKCQIFSHLSSKSSLASAPEYVMPRAAKVRAHTSTAFSKGK